MKKVYPVRNFISNGTSKLKDFFSALKSVKRQPGGLFDVGLLIKEPKSKTNAEKLFQEMKKLTPTQNIIYDQSVTDEKTIKQLVDAFKKEKWVLLEIKKDISSLLLNQLKHLANSNNLQILNFNDKEVFEMKLPEQCRLIVLAERNFIENKISYPHFYRIFGPVLSL